MFKVNLIMVIRDEIKFVFDYLINCLVNFLFGVKVVILLDKIFNVECKYW